MAGGELLPEWTEAPASGVAANSSQATTREKLF
jgi:hypothetical protein